MSSENDLESSTCPSGCARDGPLLMCHSVLQQTPFLTPVKALDPGKEYRLIRRRKLGLVVRDFLTAVSPVLVNNHLFPLILTLSTWEPAFVRLALLALFPSSLSACSRSSDIHFLSQWTQFRVTGEIFPCCPLVGKPTEKACGPQWEGGK